MHLTLPLADQRLALCVSLVCQSFSCLSVTVSHATAPAAWEPPVSGRPASPLWSERGTGGHAVGPNAEPQPRRAGMKCWYQTACLLYS